ncbi:MAG: cell wall-binding repeat-containing protein [Lachnospiraceae bacterium]|nr:cell wall-binding repeat-containing protein [Candidatus Equihabitans merdae]
MRRYKRFTSILLTILMLSQTAMGVCAEEPLPEDNRLEETAAPVTDEVNQTAVESAMGDLNAALITDPQANSALYLEDRGIPSVNLELVVGIDAINSGSREEKYPGNVLAIAEPGDGANTAVYDNVEIKGRGHSTWHQDKKPYQIKFDKKISLFGMAASKKYILLANALDASLVQSSFCMDLGAALGMYRSGYQYIDLYADGRYLGNYLLTQKVEIGKHCLPLQDNDGILVEMDFRPAKADELDILSPYSQCHMVLKDAVSESIGENEAALASFADTYAQAEEAAHDKDWDRLSSLIDLESFAAYYLLEEFIANIDATLVSFHLYRDGQGDVIHAGPAWDFDLTMINSFWNDPNRLWVATDTRDSLESHPDTGCRTNILNDLVKIPEFMKMVASLWRSTGHDGCETALTKLDEQINLISRSAAADVALWKYQYRDPDLLKAYINKREAYFDALYGYKSAAFDSENVYTLRLGGDTVSYGADQLYLDGNAENRDEGSCFVPVEGTNSYIITDESGNLALTAAENGSISLTEVDNTLEQYWTLSEDDYYGVRIISLADGRALAGVNGNVMGAQYNSSGDQAFSIGKKSQGDINQIKLTGADRYATAVLAAKEAFPEGAESIVLACGTDFPDALSAASLAGILDAPVLMSDPYVLSESLRQLLTGPWEGKVKNVYIIGGVLKDSVIAGLNECGIPSEAISKYWGQDRYQTAEAVFKQSTSRDRSIDTVAIAIGTKPADALSMSPWSYAKHIPILLANESGELSAASKALVSGYKIKHVILLGLGIKESCACGKDCIRLGGESRFETSLKIAKYFSGDSADYQGTVLAMGWDPQFPDALVAGPLAAKNGAPLVIMDGSAACVFNFLTRESDTIKNGYYVMGALGSNEQAMKRIAEALGG